MSDTEIAEAARIVKRGIRHLQELVEDASRALEAEIAENERLREQLAERAGGGVELELGREAYLDGVSAHDVKSRRELRTLVVEARGDRDAECRRRQDYAEALAAANLELDDLRSRVDAYTCELEGLRVAAAEAVTAHVELEAQRDRFEELEARHDAAVADLREIRALCGGLYGGIELPGAIAELLETSRGIRDQRIAELERALEVREGRNRELGDEIAALCAHRDSLERAVRDRDEWLAQRDAEAAAGRARIAELEAELERPAAARIAEAVAPSTSPIASALSPHVGATNGELRDRLRQVELDRDGWRSRAIGYQAQLAELAPLPEPVERNALARLEAIRTAIRRFQAGELSATAGYPGEPHVLGVIVDALELAGGEGVPRLTDPDGNPRCPRCTAYLPAHGAECGCEAGS